MTHNYTPAQPAGETETIQSMPDNSDLEGLDDSQTKGWGNDYPLDAVFVRSETRTVQEVVKRIKAKRYQLDPDFQRDFVWTIDKQSRLIESCIMRIPLPVFYVAETHDGRIAVVDGLQRLTTFSRFIGNEFPLSYKKNEDHPLNGKKFEDLSVSLQERIEDTQLTLYILDAKAPERAKLDIFERVNSGVTLSRQQMRNCLFSGDATKWLKNASESEEFLRAGGNSLDKKTMRDREVINRFCAFRILGENRYDSGDMDTFLAKALEKMGDGSIDLKKLSIDFLYSMNSNFNIFGEHAFRKSLAYSQNYSRKTVFNIALFDVFSVLFVDVDEKLIMKNVELLRTVFKELVDDDRFHQAITSSTNSTRQVKTRFSMAREALSYVLKND